MKIAYITAGAAGMYCGSCMHDNTLVAALGAQGHEALLIPTYTPIRTDEPDVSQKRVFFGGKTQAEDLGDLTVSMLKGEHGHQRKEVAKLVHWLATELRPEIINFTNA